MCGVSTTWSIASSGWPVGQLLALEVVEAGAGEVARPSASTSASVSCRPARAELR